MTELFRNSATWVIDFRYEGRPRRWFRIFRQGLDPTPAVREQIQSLYGASARLEQVRLATGEEEAQYLRGEETRDCGCPTGRRKQPL